VLSQRALSRVHERVGLVAQLELLPPLGILAREALGFIHHALDLGLVQAGEAVMVICCIDHAFV
jgi:hypothetical protein